MRVLALAWLALGMVTATPAVADWQYTKWGMTPEQVIKAAHSKSRQITRLVERQQGAAEDAGRVGQKALLSGEWSSGRFEFEVHFFFNPRRKLASVELTLANSEDEHVLANELTKRYGVPEDSGSVAGEFHRWRTQTEEIWFFGTIGAGFPTRVVYAPRHSADNSGL
ncbi:MAG TPA: hypothetical protein VHR45_12975 [Thermoanaerobaculia bacterium]|nr:hypothetical protein [Thermoanaerobaculia bacterium]